MSNTNKLHEKNSTKKLSSIFHIAKHLLDNYDGENLQKQKVEL